MNNRHPWPLKKSKSWGPFWSYQLNSTANSAHLAHFHGEQAELAVLFSWQLQNGPQNFDFFNCHGRAPNLLDIIQFSQAVCTAKFSAPEYPHRGLHGVHIIEYLFEIFSRKANLHMIMIYSDFFQFAHDEDSQIQIYFDFFFQLRMILQENF